MLFGALLLVSAILLADCWRPFHVYPSIADFNFTVVNDTMNLYFQVHQNIQNPFLHMEYMLDSGNENYDLILANKTYDACAVFKNRKTDLLLNIHLKIAEKFGDLPKRCPYQKKLYYIKNMRIDSEYLPPVLPDKNGYAEFFLANKKDKKLVTLVSGKLFFQIETSFKNGEH